MANDVRGSAMPDRMSGGATLGMLIGMVGAFEDNNVSVFRDPRGPFLREDPRRFVVANGHEKATSLLVTRAGACASARLVREVVE